MTKLLDHIDSVATKGARRQVTQSHASMFVLHRNDTEEPSAGKVVVRKTVYGKGQKVTIRQKPRR